jgi:phosphoribosylaminoimidazole-succinocarboxamide synthase
MEKVVLQTNFEDVKLANRGKVRDIYEIDGKYLLVSSDRISAFDVIMNEGIPSKGRILTEISKFWFELIKDEVENHLIATEVSEFPEVLHKYKDETAKNPYHAIRSKISIVLAIQKVCGKSFNFIFVLINPLNKSIKYL